jgi:hypothetical protein
MPKSRSTSRRLRCPKCNKVQPASHIASGSCLSRKDAQRLRRARQIAAGTEALNLLKAKS